MDARLVRYLESLGVGPEALDGWTVKVAQRDGVDVGFVVTNGPEIHMMAFDDGAMSRKNVIEHLGALIEEYGYATTRVPLSVTDHRLRTILGFEQTWQDEQFSYWAATEIPFRRKHRA